MKKIKAICIAGMVFFSTVSCNNWLDLFPENQQSSDEYWQTKEQVASVISAGYTYFRQMVTNCYLFELGELRAGCVYHVKGKDLQNFQLTPSSSSANWSTFYKVINMANSVLANAPGVMERDATFKEAVMKSYLVEAYFQRALSYFYLVRNWREVPLILNPYTTDEFSFKIAKSSEEEILNQIKTDIKTALATGAAKATYSKTWENKGRATKWALYALMADVCLWSGNYTEAIQYADYILENTSDAFCPTFMANNSQNTWFEIFNPGNSNESIFEIQYSDDQKQVNEFANKYFGTSNPTYAYTERMLQDFTDEVTESTKEAAVRTLYGGYYPDNTDDYTLANVGYIWKYTGDVAGNQTNKDGRPSDKKDPNFIIYRVAEVMLIKAEALVMQGAGNYDAALQLINQIRQRSNLPIYTNAGNTYTEQQMLSYILKERQMELAAEGKIWYDLIRIGRRNHVYRQTFIIDRVTEYSNSSYAAWLRTALKNDDALFLPVAASEMNTNTLLKQNPFYE